MISRESWECPKCQTLNASGTNCYGCGEPRPGAAAETAAPVASGREQAALFEPSTHEDAEPHPCWCDLVKGPHDTRDHPAIATAESESDADLEADAQLDRLEIDLAPLTNDWTIGQVERSYDDGGEQDYEDEMLIFEEHGYTKSVERPGGRIDAIYTSEAARVGPAGWQA